MPPRPKRDRISEIFKKPTSFKIKNQQVSVSEYKAEISQLISIMPELEKALPSSGKVIVGESAFPSASQGTQLVYALQNIKKIDPKVFELIRDKKIKDELDNIYILMKTEIFIIANQGPQPQQHQAHLQPQPQIQMLRNARIRECNLLSN